MKGYFGYVRVSTAKQGQTGSSLQEQRDAISAFAVRHNLIITEWYEDRETAAKKGRTQFVRMMTALERGKAAGVILHKIDRGARNLWDWARLQDLIEAGVAVRFAHDDLDLQSRGGRLAADIQAVVAADYVRNLRDEVRKGIRGRLKQGLFPLPAPAGYIDQGRGRPKIIDPIKGPLVRKAFELYATGRYSYNTLPLELHRMGLTRYNGKPLSLKGIGSILRNPFYIGVIRIRKTGETFQGIHQPLVAPDLFQAVQAIIDAKSNTKARRFDFVYRRLLECAECGHALTGELQKGRVYYRCHTSTCKGTGMREDAIDVVMNDAIRSLRFSNQEIEEMRPYFDEFDRNRQELQIEQSTSVGLRIAALEDRERRLTDALIDQLIDKDTFKARKSDLLVELAKERARSSEGTSLQESAQSRAKRFFELVKAFELKVDPAHLHQYRDAVRELTSNRIVAGKNLYVTTRSPFKELGEDVACLYGAPRHNAVRTSDGKRTAARKLPASEPVPLAEKYARAIHAHLKQWRPDSRPADEKPRKVHPAWFKRKEPPRDDRLAA